MRSLKAAARHFIICMLSLLILVGIPVYALGFLSGDGIDTMTSPSVVIDQPLGAYVVFINKDRHPDGENLRVWEEFFSGEEIGFLFEDISCMVISSDASGMELARSFQSRLPENQMALRTEDSTLLLSKANYGDFDVLLLSKEAYVSYGAGFLSGLPFVDTIESEGRDEEA